MSPDNNQKGAVPMKNSSPDAPNKSRHRRGGRRRGTSQQTKPAPQSAMQSEPKPKAAQQTQTASGTDTAKLRTDMPHATAKESDDIGFELISKRAPAQKYANFEEYMKAHE